MDLEKASKAYLEANNNSQAAREHVAQTLTRWDHFVVLATQRALEALEPLDKVIHVDFLAGVRVEAPPYPLPPEAS